MRKGIWLGMGCAVLVLGLSLMLQPAGAQGETVVRVLPATGTYPVGSDIPIQLWIDDVEGLYAVDIQIAFDAKRLAVVEEEVVPGRSVLWPDMIVFNLVDNDAGTIQYVASQINPRPPANGSGTLFSFTFHVLSSGDAVTSITTADLADPDGMLIDRVTEDATYTLGVTRVFLPSLLHARQAGALGGQPDGR